VLLVFGGVDQRVSSHQIAIRSKPVLDFDVVASL
jgi:hypothetical protein